MALQANRRQFTNGVRHGKELVRKNAKGVFRVVSLFVANLLGVGAGLMLAALMGIPGADDRAFVLFLLGAVNGWGLCLLYGAITGKARRRRKRKNRRIK